MSARPGITIVDAAGVPIWRVGRAPDPWAWIDRQYGGEQRWDDPGQLFRTIYAADTAYACYVEILAHYRPDRFLEQDLGGITEDPADAAEFPVPPAGVVDPNWIGAKMRSSGTLTGPFADVRASTTIAALRPAFLDIARHLGYKDFDASAVKSAHPRELTQLIAQHLYSSTDGDGAALVDGVRFASRHGDDLSMWAIFERPGDEPSSRHITNIESHLVELDDPDLRDAMNLHGLRWPHTA